MKKVSAVIITIAMMISFVVVSTSASLTNTATTVFTVGGMTCQSCVNAVRNAVSALNGVTEITIVLSTGTVTVVHDSSISVDTIRETIVARGYTAVLVSTTLPETTATTETTTTPQETTTVLPETTETTETTATATTPQETTTAVTLSETTAPSSTTSAQYENTTQQTTVTTTAESTIVWTQSTTALPITTTTQQITTSAIQTITTSGPATITSVFIVEGMTCQSCVNAIRNAVSVLNGVVSVTVILDTGEVTVVHTSNVSVGTIENVIIKEGFTIKTSVTGPPIGTTTSALATTPPTTATTSSATSPTPQPNTIMAVLIVEGMTCTRCEAAIERAVLALDGVISVSAVYNTGTVTVVYAPNLSVTAIQNAILSEGYTVISVTGGSQSETTATTNALPVSTTQQPDTTPATTPAPQPTNATTILIVEGMTCQSCVRAIEKAVSALSGVLSVSVSLDTGRVTVVHNLSLTAQVIENSITAENFTVLSAATTFNYNSGKENSSPNTGVTIGFTPVIVASLAAIVSRKLKYQNSKKL